MSRHIPIRGLLILIVTGIALIAPSLQAQTSGLPYSLPNNNAGCPANCRVIPWQAGSDLWNGGTLPVYPQVTCSPLAEDGVTDDTTNLQSCINAANAGTGAYASCHAAGGCATFIPAGTVVINGTLRLKSYVVLRGAGPTTHINLGSGGALTTTNWSYNGGLTPTVSYGCFSSCQPYQLSGTPQKGDTTVTISSGTVAVGNWISISGNDDPTLITSQGTDGFCKWCGWNMGYYLMQQIVQVTGFVSGSGGSGTVVSLSRPLYYTPYTAAVTNANGQSGSSEPAGSKYRIWTPATTKAGYEYFNLTATSDIGSTPMVDFQGCLYCWAKGLEVQDTGSSSGSAHIEFDWSYGGEVRDSYLHDQRSGASGSGYGVYFQWVNSDHKVENNICRHSRHCIVYQGGGSGTAVLYNYFDDMYTDDTTYLGSARTSHGAHPFMNLFEGNVISHVAADDFWGTSSHTVFFRNWLWGDETENWTGAQSATGTPNNGFAAVDLYQSQEYYSFVGNVLGRTGLHSTWSAATLTKTCSTNGCGYEAPATPAVYSTGSSQLTAITGSATSANTILRHGNWDYKTGGVAFWDGGANHTLASSAYYTNQPAFLSGYPWPLEGPEGSPTTNANPAEKCYLSGPSVGSSFSPAACYSSGTSQNPPAPPTQLTVVVN